LGVGRYIVQVEDANGQTAAASFEVLGPEGTCFQVEGTVEDDTAAGVDNALVAILSEVENGSDRVVAFDFTKLSGFYSMNVCETAPVNGVMIAMHPTFVSSDPV